MVKDHSDSERGNLLHEGCGMCYPVCGIFAANRKE